MNEAREAGLAFAKTTRPTIGSVIERDVLFARLDEPPGRTLIWISGPPGSGKTTLAASYIRARGLQSLWFQVDRDDADPASFFHYLGHAARKLRGARELPAFSSRHVDDVAGFASRFFRELFSGAPEPMTLVLDNLHMITGDSGFHAALDAGMSQVPKQCCVIVTSRSEPPSSFARRRASGQMNCVTGQELRIDAREIVAIAALRGQPVSPESAAKLCERTQGWAAGIVLMLEHARFSGRIAEPPANEAPQVVFDYLASEIFARFEPDARHFLMRVACLPRMTASVAQALSGEAKAERLLQNLARNDYFVGDSSFEETRIYQVHPLLREFLRARASQILPEATSEPWLRRAALLLENAGQAEDAIALLIDAHDWTEVARVTLAQAETVLAQGRSETLARWLEMLPADLVEADPRLLHALATARAPTSARAARQLFERAYNGFETIGDPELMTRSCCGVVDAIVGEFDDLTPLDQWLERLELLLAKRIDRSSTDIDVAATATLVRATLLRDPGNGRVEKWLGLAGHPLNANFAGAAAEFGGVPIILPRAFALLARGEIVAAANTLDALNADSAANALATDSAQLIGRCLIDIATGAYEDARRRASDGLAGEGLQAIQANRAWLRMLAATAGACAGDPAAARNDLAPLEGNIVPLRRGDRAYAHHLQAFIAMIDGDAIVAQHHAKHALAAATEVGMPWLECMARMLIAQLHAEADDRQGAAAQLRAVDALVDRLRSPWLALGGRLATAVCARAEPVDGRPQGRPSAAFCLGRESGLRPPPGIDLRALGDLCALALNAEIEPFFARALIREGKLVPRVPPLRVRGWPWPFRVMTCGKFVCLRDDAPIELSGKGPGRPIELLKVLIASGSHGVRADQIADALWPHMDADYAYKSFTATLHRLRRLLDDDALILRDGRLSLSETHVWIDTWALEQLFDDLDSALRAEGADLSTVRHRFLDEALALYRGPFLPDEAEQPSYIACKERLRARLLRFLARIVRGCEEEEPGDFAADCYLRFIEIDELCEPLYRQLMQIYQRSGATIEAMATYERLRTTLATRQKMMPSPESQALYANLRSAATLS